MWQLLNDIIKLPTNAVIEFPGSKLPGYCEEVPKCAFDYFKCCKKFLSNTL